MAKRYNSFAEQRPDLMKLWDYKKNSALGLDPKVLSAHSGKKAWWTCREKGHSYLRTIDKQNNKNGRCPKCGKDYITDIPELVKMFDKEKNTINIEELTTGSGKSIWWKCDSNHSFERSVYDHVRRDYKCPTCTHEPITNYPHLVEEFDKEKNEIPIEQVTVGTDYKIHWKCKKKGHEWEAQPYHRVGGKTNCPHCWRESRVQRAEATAARKQEEREKSKLEKQKNREEIEYQKQKKIEEKIIQKKIREEELRLQELESEKKRVEKELKKKKIESEKVESQRLLYEEREKRRLEREEQKRIEKERKEKRKEIREKQRRILDEVRKENQDILDKIKEEEKQILERLKNQKQLLNKKEQNEKTKKITKHEEIIKEEIEEEEIVFELLGKGKKQKTINIEESIAHVYPKLKDLWNKERNGGLEATEVSAYTSGQHYWWKCGKHEWFATLYSMINSTGNGCPYCLKRRSKYSVW